MKTFQDEETEAYQGVICPRLSMGLRSGQMYEPQWSSL